MADIFFNPLCSCPFLSIRLYHYINLTLKATMNYTATTWCNSFRLSPFPPRPYPSSSSCSCSSSFYCLIPPPYPPLPLLLLFLSLCITPHTAATNDNNIWRDNDNDNENENDDDGSDAEEKEGMTVERVQSPFLRTSLEGGIEGPGSNRGNTPTARAYSNFDPFSPGRPVVRDTRITVQDPGPVPRTLTRTISSQRTGAISNSYSSVLSEMEGGMEGVIDLRAEKTLELGDSVPMSPTNVPRKLLNPTLKGVDPGSSIPYMPLPTTHGDEEGGEGQWKGMDTQCSYGSDSSSSYYSTYSPPSASASASTSVSTSQYSTSQSNLLSKDNNVLSELDQIANNPTDPRVPPPILSGSSASQTQYGSRFPASINTYSLQTQSSSDRDKGKAKGNDRSRNKESASDIYARQSNSPVPSSASSPYSPLLSPPNSASTVPKMGERNSYGGV